MKREIEMLIEENKKLKKKVEEAEGENTIIKGIGNNSPEMRTLKDQVNSLTAQLKEKDLMIEQEVVYKMEERKKWEGLSNEIHKIKKQLGFYIAFNKFVIWVFVITFFHISIFRIIIYSNYSVIIF